ncbi:MAG: hypothetical protein OEM46_03290 [Ignavibacteria bacterium]|nr:hypothetical protein [Ignavibacteria bacterium]
METILFNALKAVSGLSTVVGSGTFTFPTDATYQPVWTDSLAY